MAEVAGLVIVVVGIVAAFKEAIETGVFIRSFLETEGIYSIDLGLYYLIEKTRLQLWGEQARRQADNLVKKYDVVTPEVPGRAVHNLARILQEVKPRRRRLGWVIYAKDQFKEKIEIIRNHTTHLHDITLEYKIAELLENCLPGRVLPKVNNNSNLRILYEPNPVVNQPLALSALVKLHHQMASMDSNGSATCVTKNELELFGTSLYTGRFKHPDGTVSLAWVEWNILDTGSAADVQKYIDRINSLGFVLEKVSDPVLRPPPCYGVFVDSLNAGYSAGRLGYVFGLPSDQSTRGKDYSIISYERDLCTYPPIRLSDLIRNQEIQIPLLGDRFQLAYALARAFSRFHAAGWLHKGFHTGNILFFQKRGGRVDITEPFIAGFQYSRPQGDISLAYSPLRKEVEHYYHPNAHIGFTKGRTSIAWVCRVLADLGWRMGDKYHSAARALLACELPDDQTLHDYFAEQFLEKVMKPLSSCSA
ncbi:hypothetical protein F5Y11DRAFT_358821 [Daldinia sp. FL1419]|nr:hypothetical protein F5Y11DRAFT_358821 [Daldinia sp. FL1419]